MMESAIKVIQAKGTQLTEEAESLYAKEEAESAAREDRVRRALTSLQEVRAQGEQVLTSGGQARLLRQFGKLKGRSVLLNFSLHRYFGMFINMFRCYFFSIKKNKKKPHPAN